MPPEEAQATIKAKSMGLGAALGVLNIGQVLADRYRLEELLGRGGMGAVYKAVDEGSGRLVAIKTILPLAGAEVARRFRREFRALTRLSHPHIVAVDDFGQVNGLPYYVMEYLQGADLSKLLASRTGFLSVSETVTVGLQMGQALAYIHNLGIVHRDIKPANIMVLSEDGLGTEPAEIQTKLTDFGVIQMADVSAQLTASGQLIGTLKYLAPEQLRGLRADRRADLYALGLALFEVATGGFPFGGASPMAMAFRRLDQPPASMLEFKPDLPAEIDRIVLKLLAADINQRYASAEELLADLAALSDVSAVVVAPPAARADIIAQPPLVGRDIELEQLFGRLQAAWSGPGPFVLVEGEAGVGKSRLLEELAALVRQHGGRRMHGRCYEEERLAYGPFVDAFEGLAAGRAEQLATALEGLESQLGRLIPSLDLTMVDMPDLEPEQARLRLFDAVTRFLARLASDRPLLLILDDLHWADEATLGMLHYLVRNSQQLPVLICGTARLEELDQEHPLCTLLQNLARRGMAERMLLSPLSQEAVAELACGLLAGGTLPAQLSDRLYWEAEGNPFFVEEMLKAWVEEGRLLWEAEGWRLAEIETFVGLTIPGTIADIVGRRLRGLGSFEAGLLEMAAVLGREFNLDVLLLMETGVDEDRLFDAIDDLLRARLLEEVHHVREDRYRFAHGKIQEVVYGRQPRRKLRRLHRQAGEALEEVYAGRLVGLAEPLARHFLAAGDARGVAYGLRAGDEARAVFANRQALDFYARSLELVEALGATCEDTDLVWTVIQLRANSAQLLFILGEFGPAEENYRLALDLLASADMIPLRRGRQQAVLHRHLSELYEQQGRYETAREELDAALAALSQEDGRSRELALVHKSIGWVQRRQGDNQAAVVSCRRGLELAPPDAHDAIADLYDTLGVIYRTLGDFGRAAEYHRRSLQLREAMEDQPGIAKTCNNLLAISWRQKHYAAAIEYGSRGLAICEKMGHVTGLASLYNNLGLIYSEQGDLARAIQHYEDAMAMFQRTGNQLGVALASGNLGEAYQAKGDLPRAADHLGLALEQSVDVGDREGIAYAQALLAQVYLAQGDLERAIDCGQEALEAALDIGARPYQAQAHQVLGQAYRARGDRDAARQQLEAALKLYTDLGDLDNISQVTAAIAAMEST